MKKKVVLLSAGLFIVVGILTTHVAFATSITGKNLLKSVDILGISVVRSGSIKFDLIDAADLGETSTMTLPSISGNDGMVYVYKFVTDGEHYIGLFPAGSDKLEGQTENPWYLGESLNNEAVTLIADQATDSWWIINYQDLPVL